jgi:hypothetical protein
MPGTSGLPDMTMLLLLLLLLVVVGAPVAAA